jgi:hypothetical protein
MYSRDYILRMIELIGQLIAAILGKIRKGEYDTASRNLSNLYYDVLKEDAAYFRNLNEKDITSGLLKDHDYTSGHLEILGELFNAEAELCLARNDKNGCLEYSRKSLLLLEFVDSETKTYSLERINKMESIRKRMDECQLVS